MRDKKKIVRYLEKEIQHPGERIEPRMHPNCEVVVVIPAYGERDYILEPLASLANQKGVNPHQYEVIVVVNNPGSKPKRTEGQTDEIFKKKCELYNKAIGENQEILDIVRYIRGENVNVKQRPYEKKILNRIKHSGVQIFAIDKASPGKTLPDAEANCGGARNRGLAEAVARFYEHLGKNGIVAQTDADTSVDENYIQNLIHAFEEKPEMVALVGKNVFKEIKNRDSVDPKVYVTFFAVFTYKTLFNMLTVTEGENPDQELKENVYLVGCNMASRAFESAVVGGIPKITSGSDVEFGKKLEDIGKIEYNENIKTVTAIRYSPRVEGGFGGRMIKYSEDMINKGIIEVPNPKKALIIKQIKTGINELLKTGEMTSAKLKEFFEIENHTFIDDGDLQLLTQELSGISELKIKHLYPAANSILKKVFSKIEKVDPIDLTEATDLILDILCINEVIRRKYGSIIAQMIEQIENRGKIVNYILDKFFEDKPQNLNGNTILGEITNLKKRMGLSDEFIVEITNSFYILEMLSEIITKAKTKQAVEDLIKEKFIGIAVLPGRDSLEFKYIELAAMKEAVLPF